MDRFRTAHTPMDYEYTNGTGPVDENSPFITASRNANTQNKKRTHSLFDSPAKQTPSLRAPASQPFYFSQSPASFPGYSNSGRNSSPTKPLSSVPEHLDPKFTTPRKLNTTFDFSSGGETPETPGDPDGNNADSEATPDSSFMGFRNRAVNFMAGGKNKDSASPTKSPTKERRRDSWLGSVTKALSPAKDSGSSKAVFSDKAEKRIVRRRQKEAERRRGSGRSRRNADVDSDEDEKNSAAKAAGTDTAPHIVATILSYIDAHPNLPNTLSLYVQLALNAFLISVLMWIVYSFWSAIQGDVNLESDRAIADALAEMAVCAKNYRENRCEPETRVPAMEVICGTWETCMQRDPKKVGRAKVSAHTFATIFNSFLEPISWKAWGFITMLIVAGLIANNVAFVKFRNSHPVHHPQQPPHHDPSQGQFYQQQQWQQRPQWAIPPTPQRYPSGGWDTPGHPMMAGGYYPTPAQLQMQQHGYFEPTPSQTPGGWQQQQQRQQPGSTSPVKRLQF